MFSKQSLLGVFVLLCTFVIPCESMAEGRQSLTSRDGVVTRSALDQFSDSLRHLADSLYSPKVKAPQLLSRQDMAPFFLPLTFYKDVAKDAFALGDTLNAFDKHLIYMYLNRPDLVRSTQSQLEQSGPVLVAKTVTETPNVPVAKVPVAQATAVPLDMVVLKPNFWAFSGEYYLQFLQNYISGNWYKGGESNYSMVGSVVLTANYNNKSKIRWDNKLEMKLGLQTAPSDTIHSLRTTSDLFRYTGKLGLEASKKWYYTLQVIAYSQFMKNYKTNEHTVISDFLSPLNVNLSLGMDYSVDWFKHRLVGTAHLAPLAYNLKYVGRLDLAPRYGLKPGEHLLHDFGSQFTVELKWKMFNNFSWQTRLYGYTTYKRSEVEWENTFNFKFNKYISTQLFLYPRFDDGVPRDPQFGYIQLKEYISLGFSYGF